MTSSFYLVDFIVIFIGWRHRVRNVKKFGILFANVMTKVYITLAQDGTKLLAFVKGGRFFIKKRPYPY